MQTDVIIPAIFAAQPPHMYLLLLCMQGAMTEERLPKEAAVRVAMALGTSVGGEADEASRLFSSIDRAQEGVAALAGSSAAAAVQLDESTARVQAMTGQVLSRMVAAPHTWCSQVSPPLMSFVMLTSCSMLKPASLWAGVLESCFA